jgi:CHAD domain-containing protein
MRTTGGPPVADCPSPLAILPHTRQARPVPRSQPDVLRHLGRALPRQWRRYRKRLKRCQQKFSEAAVHGSRVETRRLLATLEVLAAFIPTHQLKKPRRALKEHLDAFDHLRDTQVQLAVVAPMRRAFPAAQEFQAWLRQREIRFIREARKAVKQIKPRRVGKRIAAFEGELRRQRKSVRPEKAFRMAQAAVRLAFARVTRFCRRVNAADIQTIHRTRIAFKRFRYMVEALSPLLPAVTDEYRAAIRRYQTMMGDIQDWNILLTALDQFLEAEDNDSAALPLRAEFLRRRQKLVHLFVTAAGKLWSFWPPNKLSPHPNTTQTKQP